VETELSRRLATAVIGVPLLVVLVVWGAAWLFYGVFLLLTVAALREFFVMALPGRRSDQWSGIGFGIALSCAVFLNGKTDSMVWLSAVLLTAFGAHMFMAGALAERFQRLLLTLLGVFYIGYLFPHWVLLFRAPFGRGWVLWLLTVIMVGDTLAYLVGRRFGARKLAPEISPGKTVAGAWAYVVGAMTAGVAGAGLLVPHLSWLEALGLSFTVSLLGQLGDLFESWIKRVCAVKDSGNLLPGHGGLLDRIDSLIFPAVFTTSYLRVFHS